MDIRGLVLINSASVDSEHQDQFPRFLPGLTDVAGKSALERTAERLQKFGISPVTAVIEGDPLNGGIKPIGSISQIVASSDRFWQAAESVFNDMVQIRRRTRHFGPAWRLRRNGFREQVQFHLDRNERVSEASGMSRRWQFFCISASRRNDAASFSASTYSLPE